MATPQFKSWVTGNYIMTQKNETKNQTSPSLHFATGISKRLLLFFPSFSPFSFLLQVGLVSGGGNGRRLLELVAGWELVEERVVWVVRGFGPEQVTPAAVELCERLHVFVRDFPVKEFNVCNDAAWCLRL